MRLRFVLWLWRAEITFFFFSHDFALHSLFKFQLKKNNNDSLLLLMIPYEANEITHKSFSFRKKTKSNNLFHKKNVINENRKKNVEWLYKWLAFGFVSKEDRVENDISVVPQRFSI